MPIDVNPDAPPAGPHWLVSACQRARTARRVHFCHAGLRGGPVGKVQPDNAPRHRKSPRDRHDRSRQPGSMSDARRRTQSGWPIGFAESDRDGSKRIATSVTGSRRRRWCRRQIGHQPCCRQFVSGRSRCIRASRSATVLGNRCTPLSQISANRSRRQANGRWQQPCSRYRCRAELRGIPCPVVRQRSAR